ncbi:hypothetical protein AVEN_208385-1 [Araneus ventricosus]|uniref:Uncharacterized protein n=1 Tax=Araneus ventricosus TaxID=182803 RepID=A0A4Y2N607_ARAVE|nr:hypothetical protein AVEN_208385-1 [Araneus ventricosus]
MACRPHVQTTFMKPSTHRLALTPAVSAAREDLIESGAVLFLRAPRQISVIGSSLLRLPFLHQTLVAASVVRNCCSPDTEGLTFSYLATSVSAPASRSPNSSPSQFFRK